MLRREPVDFCGANEVIVGQAVDCVRRISNRARPVLHCQDRMMALDNSYPRDGIGKSETAAIGREIECPHNIEAIIGKLPVRMQRFEQRSRLINAQWLHTTLTRLATAIREIG